MTETLIYGIRYTGRDGSTVTTPAPSLTDAKAALGELVGEQGLVAEIVSAQWTVNAGVSRQTKRDLVEKVIDDLVQEEITAEEAAAQLHYLASGLLPDATVDDLRADGVHIPDDCTMAIWIERAANLYTELQKPEQDRDRHHDYEAVGVEYDNHLDVLAGVVDHGGNVDYDCPSCARIITVKAVA